MVPTWYPGIILLQILQEGRSYAVSGRVIDTDGNPAANASVTLEWSQDWSRASVDAQSRTGPDGTFQFPNVAGGEWRLFATATSSRGELQSEGVLEVSGDISDLTLRLNPPFSLSGDLRCEGGKDAPLISANIALMPFINGSSTRTAQSSEGAFVLERVYPGEYRVQLTGVTDPDCYLSSIMLDGQEALGRRLEVSPYSKLSVTYKRNGGSVRGTVSASNVKRVILIPADANLNWPDLAFSTSSIADGRFEIRAVRPGSYYALALSEGSEWSLLTVRNSTVRFWAKL